MGRLTRRREFLYVAKGDHAAGRTAVVQARASEAAGSGCRFGVTATKKIGGAVVRNRAKRRLRQAARQLLPRLGRPGVDYVFIARAATPTCAWERLLDDVKTALVSLAPAALGVDGGRSTETG